MRRATTIFTLALVAAVLCVCAAAPARAQYTRTALLEEFTSLTCKPCTTATPIINNLIRDRAGRVVSVRYHANLPFSGDPYYDAIKDQINARKTYYGVAALPFGRVDGSTNVTVTVEGEVQDKTDARLAAQSPIKMQVTQTRSGDSMHVDVHLTADDQGLSGADYRLRVIAVEAHIHDTRFVGDPKYNGETELYDVVRMLVNGGDGATIALSPSEDRTVSFAYKIGDGWNADQIYSVAFVQNDDDQEVMQAGYSTRPVSGVRNDPAVVIGNRTVYAMPSPASMTTTIEYLAPAHEEVRATVFDLTGGRVAEGRQTSEDDGWHAMQMDISALAPGSYTVVMQGRTFTHTCRLLVVR